MSKALLVTTSLPDTDKRYKKFVKLLNRKGEARELWPGAWFVKSEKRPHIISERLSGLFEDEPSADEQFVVTTVGPDWEHLHGYLTTRDESELKRWDWIRQP